MRDRAQNGGWLLLALAGGAALAYLTSRPKPRFSFRNRVAVITGGSRGLGLLLARHLAAEGAPVVLLARSETELRRAKQELDAGGAGVMIIPCDIRDQQQVNRAFQQVVERFGRIDVLINNAGIIQVGPLAHMTVDDFKEAMAVHFYGPLYTTMAALPHLRAGGGGRIVNISSIGGRVAVPHLLPYVASKFALAGLSEGLGAELRQEKIYVTTVYPAPMRTGSPPNARFKGKHHLEYAWFSIMDSLPLMSVSGERAAQKILDACRRGSPRLALGYQTKGAILANDLVPGLTARIMSIVNRVLPSPHPAGSTESFSGWESHSSVSPSVLTRLSDKASARNNQRPVTAAV